MYTQITAAERYTIALFRQQGYIGAAIARLLGHHRSMISRGAVGMRRATMAATARNSPIRTLGPPRR